MPLGAGLSNIIFHPMIKNNNVIWRHAAIKRADRGKLNGRKSAGLWFTGLSGAGKSTLAHAIEGAG